MNIAIPRAIGKFFSILLPLECKISIKDRFYSINRTCNKCKNFFKQKLFLNWQVWRKDLYNNPNQTNEPWPKYTFSSCIRRYELSDGTKQFEIGYTRYTSDGTPYQVAEGYYIYKTPDNQWVRVAYFADKDGYKVIDSECDTYCIRFLSIVSVFPHSLYRGHEKTRSW